MAHGSGHAEEIKDEQRRRLGMLTRDPSQEKSSHERHEVNAHTKDQGSPEIHGSVESTLRGK